MTRTCSTGRPIGSSTAQLIRRTPGVRPGQVCVVELAGNVATGVDANLAQGFDDLRVRDVTGDDPRRARRVCFSHGALEQVLGHHAPPLVADADEEDVHAALRAAAGAPAGSPRTSWYTSAPSDAPSTGATM
jgi:hypothetical protein